MRIATAAPRAALTGVPAAPVTASTGTRRIASLDIVRGVVMILMAIDHVRVFSGVPAGGPTPGVFLTRWVTNFVAPAFVFLAGTAAWLYGQKVGDRRALARFLVTRGAWLVLLELTVIRLGWTFNLDFAHYLLAGVIWMIGWCMILMAGLVYLPLAAIGTLGIAVVALHNLMDPYVRTIQPALREASLGWLWKTLYFGGGVQVGGEGGPPLVILYVLVPWIGVMAAGYAFGPVMRMDAERRRKICLWLGCGALALFLVLRALDGYGDPRPWHSPAGAPRRMPAAFAFINTAKYPASLDFLLMTLAPVFIAIPFLERARGRVANVLAVYGRVPFFYYLLHIPAIHLAACLVSVVREGSVNPWLFANHPMMNPPPPDGYTWSLPLLYLVTALVVAALYVPCRWYAALKARSTSKWLSYL